MPNKTDKEMEAEINGINEDRKHFRDKDWKLSECDQNKLREAIERENDEKDHKDN